MTYDAILTFHDGTQEIIELEDDQKMPFLASVSAEVPYNDTKRDVCFWLPTRNLRFMTIVPTKHNKESQICQQNQRLDLEKEFLPKAI